jgi:hypothetical protein
MTEADSRFAESAIRRRPLFLALSLAGIGVAVLLAAYYGHRRLQDPSYPLGVRAALVTLILLNARQNLRQYRYAGVLASTLFRKEVGGRPQA